ncbi:hypothetical protein ACWD00_37125 [Streptomyces viridiviolaceus]
MEPDKDDEPAALNPFTSAARGVMVAVSAVVVLAGLLVTLAGSP